MIPPEWFTFGFSSIEVELRVEVVDLDMLQLKTGPLKRELKTGALVLNSRLGGLFR